MTGIGLHWGYNAATRAENQQSSGASSGDCRLSPFGFRATLCCLVPLLLRAAASCPGLKVPPGFSRTGGREVLLLHWENTWCDPWGCPVHG